jgi:hypothetical protein
VRDSLTATERLDYTALRAFLSPERSSYPLVFPTWTARFAEFEAFTNEVLREALAAQNVRGSRRPQVPSAATKEAAPSIATYVAQALLQHLAKTGQLPKGGRDAESILHNLIITPEHAYLFLRAMQTIKA